MRLALTLLVLAACDTKDGTSCGAAAVTDACPSASSEDDCLAAGGCWGIWGLSPDASCNCPTTDAGARCTSDEGCEGSCVGSDTACQTVTEGTCSEYRGTYGCFCSPMADGSWETLCAD